MHHSDIAFDEDTLASDVQKFVQGFRSLLIPSPEVLINTATLLRKLILVSDKVLPVKSYFNMVQQMQRVDFFAQTMAAAAVESEKLTGEAAAARTRDIINDIESKGMALWSQVMSSQNANPELKEQLKGLERESQRVLCTEDTFVVVCAFLQGEVAKQGSVYYLRGQSPDFKETKKHRNPLDLTKEVALKSLSSALARPDMERGVIERGQIESGFNHLARLNAFSIIMYEVVEWIKASEKAGTPCRKIDVRSRFGLSHTDYERVMAMARREGLYTLRGRKRDPANRYSLKAKAHQRVVEQAEISGCTPQKALNKMLDDFFSLIDYANRMGRSPEQIFSTFLTKTDTDESK